LPVNVNIFAFHLAAAPEALTTFAQRGIAARNIRLNAEFVKVLSASDFKAWLMDQGADAAPGTPDELGASVKAEIARYAPLFRKSGMRPD
jgi:tripartite-type tricarboxylate transporter receptor subunit TctC